jgi:NAD(P)-dependent dehydrogenase (short-subunit alcohol dehydrogenase family)
LLLPQITDRVVTVASGAHRGGSISLDDLNWERRSYKRWAAYQQSKLANLLFTLELQRRLTAVGSRIRALAAHPGYTATNLQFRSERGLEDRLMAIGNRLFAQSDEAGARPTLFAATQDLPGASYVGPDGLGEYRGYPTLVGRTAAASDVEMAKRLWTLSEELTGVKFPLVPVH